MAARYDLTIDQGATFTFDLEVQSINLTTGYTVRMQGRTSHAATTTLFSLTSGGGGISLSHSAGNSHIIPTISATATAALNAPLSGVYDIEYQETATGFVTRILEGSFHVTPEVTRA